MTAAEIGFDLTDNSAFARQGNHGMSPLKKKPRVGGSTRGQKTDRRGADQKRLAMLNPMIRGSSVNTLVVRPESSLLMKASVIGVALNRFFT